MPIPPQKSDSNYVSIFSICFTIIAIVALFALVVVKSRADVATQDVSLTNEAPLITTLINSATWWGPDLEGGTLSLTEGATTEFFVRSFITDINGCSEIYDTPNNVLTIYRSDVANGADCTPDDNDCYRIEDVPYDVGSCTGFGDPDTSLFQDFSFPMNYYADPTDAGSPHEATTWQSTFTVFDDFLASGTLTTGTFEVASLAALTVTPSIPYGILALSADSAEQTITFTNTGNRDVDTEYITSSADNGNMVCNGSGSLNIPAGNVKISLSTGFDYDTQGASLPAASASAATLSLGLAQRTSGLSTRDAYLILRIPDSGLSGTCTNTVTFTAVAI